MRNVYQPEKNPSGLVLSILFSVGLTGLLFGLLPFAHRVARPERQLELRKTSATDLPPPDETETPPPPIEAERPPDAPPEPQLSEAPPQIPLSADLELAAGSGGALAGFGETRNLATAEAAQDDAFDVSELEKRPTAITQVPPTYPADLRKAKIEGTVTLVFVLDETGRVEDPRVEASTRIRETRSGGHS
jgi:periplasmic protein TonB